MQNSKRFQKDIKQVKFLREEMRKARDKCIELCEQLNHDLPHLQKYERLLVQCTRGVDSLDKAGLINLQAELAKSLAELYEAERGYMYEAEKNSFKKIAVPAPTRRKHHYESKQDLQPFKIPTYYSCPESSVQKIEKISNYIKQIGRSMDSLRKSMESGGNWDPKIFLQYEPQFLTTKRKIEQFKMRDQELVDIIQRKIAEQIEKIVSAGQQAQENDEYIVMKIPKVKIDDFGKPNPEISKPTRRERVAEKYHPVSMIEPRGKKAVSKKTTLERINQEGQVQENQKEAQQQPEAADLHINSFQKSHKAHHSRVSKIGDSSQMDCDQNGNYVYMVKKVSPDSQLNSSIISSISSLRSLRKKVFDDDIWDEFEKL